MTFIPFEMIVFVLFSLRRHYFNYSVGSFVDLARLCVLFLCRFFRLVLSGGVLASGWICDMQMLCK